MRPKSAVHSRSVAVVNGNGKKVQKSADTTIKRGPSSFNVPTHTGSTTDHMPNARTAKYNDGLAIFKGHTAQGIERYADHARRFNC